MMIQSDPHHCVDREPLVGVDGNTEEAGVGVDQPLNIPLVQVEEDRSVVEVGEVGHVLAAIILGRVDLCDQLLLVLFCLSCRSSLCDLHLHLVSIRLFDHPLQRNGFHGFSERTN